MAITRLAFTGVGAAYGTFAPKTLNTDTADRRGPRARGRARLQGRRLWWLVALIAGGGWS